MIAQKLGASCDVVLRAKADVLAQAARRGFVADVEWSDPRERFIIDPESSQAYAGMVATRVMLSKVTFAQEPYEEIAAQIDAAEAFFSRSKSYAGVAIHYYKTYRAKVLAAKKLSE